MRIKDNHATGHSNLASKALRSRARVPSAAALLRQPGVCAGLWSPRFFQPASYPRLGSDVLASMALMASYPVMETLPTRMDKYEFQRPSAGQVWDCCESISQIQGWVMRVAAIRAIEESLRRAVRFSLCLYVAKWRHLCLL